MTCLVLLLSVPLTANQLPLSNDIEACASSPLTPTIFTFHYIYKSPLYVTSPTGSTRRRCASCELCSSPALLMVGRAPLRAHRRLPPNGTYCWLRGRDSVFRSCRRCFSLRMEWTAFRKSFLLSGELHVGREENVCKAWEGGAAERTAGLRYFILPAAQLEGSLRSSL